MAHTEDSLIACDMPVYPTLKVTFMFTDVYGQNGKSQNGDKPNYECECVCVDIIAVSIAVVVHIRNQKFYPRIELR